MNILFRKFSTSEKAAFKLAFINTVPIFAGFLFLGMAYGIYMTSAGFNPLYPALMSTLIFAGSMEFLTVNLLLSTFDPLGAFLLTLMVNARHLFYGLAMLEPYNRLNGWRKSYLIFGMCDESFSINYTSNISRKTDKNSYMFYVTILNHFYWFLGSALGGFLGSFFTLQIPGLSFVMTALFIVIFIEQLLTEKNYLSSMIGIIFPIICIIFWGVNNFMLPAMLIMVLVLTLIKNKIPPKEVICNDFY